MSSLPRHLPIAHSLSGSASGPSTALSGAASVDAAELLQVGDVAKAAGKTVRAIHHYEELGLLRPHGRSKGRYRLYDDGAITRIRWIGKLHDLGLSLSQIQEIIRAWEASPSAPDAMARMRETYREKLEQTRAQITHLESLEHELVASLHYLDTCETCDPAELVAACKDCNLHAPDQHEPELVAGIHTTSERKRSARCKGT